MVKIILMACILGTGLYADFMDSVANVVKSTLSDEEESIPEVKTVGTLSVTSGGQQEKESFLDTVVDSVKKGVGVKKEKVEESSMIDDVVSGVKSTIGIKDDKPKKSSSIIGNAVTAMKEVTGLEKVKQDNSFFDGGIMGDMADMISLEKGESYGLPSVFGLNKKKEKKVFGSTILGDTVLGDVKDTGTTFYRGFKNTGESTEFMSGVMYKSSKIYNGMFEMFDDSPFNIFDDKDEREPSIFDAFDKGNDVLDIFN